MADTEAHEHTRNLPKNVCAAYDRIKGFIYKTPVLHCPYLSGSAQVYYKLDNEQLSGAFKVRGAFNKLLLLKEKDPDLANRGIITASSGNHGIACVVGCQPDNSKIMYECVKAGRQVHLESLDTLSDGTAGDVEEGAITYPLCRDFVDQWLIVTEEQIAEAVYFMLDKHHKLIEGSAAVTIAAYVANKQMFEGKHVVLLMCGANIGTDKLKKIIDTYIDG